MLDFSAAIDTTGKQQYENGIFLMIWAYMVIYSVSHTLLAWCFGVFLVVNQDKLLKNIHVTPLLFSSDALAT